MTGNGAEVTILAWFELDRWDGGCGKVLKGSRGLTWTWTNYDHHMTFDWPRQCPQTSTKFGDMFTFSRPAPKTINEVVIVGFVLAVAVELASGEDLVTQLSSGGMTWQYFHPQRRCLNGRLAMIGLVALAVTEYVKGGPLV
ncbi:hypothetical protein SUGI_0867290 [Cryptomeria japonica]|nr:hypothetical protein SUGI_0867290 [Cryptomeria japonica]